MEVVEADQIHTHSKNSLAGLMPFGFVMLASTRVQLSVFHSLLHDVQGSSLVKEANR